MSLGVLNEPSSVTDRAIDLSRRNDVLLGTSVAQDRATFMEEIENPVMHVAMSHPQFIDVIAQIIRFWTSQFVSAFREPFDANGTLVASLDLESVHPRQ
ncbi:MAG: hypothetical protein ABS36_12800 [Acidobacteria bacterium SCN 69-37]|nr:MAG: hypothetical protein ABS36_12800 [Acidobacteria bacterium SCN 69-37]